MLQKISLLSGPNLALEIAEQKPAAMVIASVDSNVASRVQRLLVRPYLRVYTSVDLIGVELGGTLKNVIAIAAGIVDGLNLGSNARSGLIVRGIVEMALLAEKMGAQQNTLFGLTGLGDLITTCSSTQSRNHTVGERLAKGEKIEEIIASMTAVAEGVKTAKVVKELSAKYKIEMPICAMVYKVLFEEMEISQAVTELMIREPKPEN
jgi:glycerol-3-phosphate dehydrogenase (NAD(P)+)